MKSFAFCTCYVNENYTGHSHLRYSKWIKYYLGIMDKLGVDYLFLIDDGSDNLFFDEYISIVSPQLPPFISSKVNIVHFGNKLGRASMTNYKGWWRSFTFCLTIAQKYNFDKIIHLESDFYVVSEELMKFVNEVKNGWTTLFSRGYAFPETAFQIICKDTFDKLKIIADQAIIQDYQFNMIAEHILPFTEINYNFYGDRFGEVSILEYWSKSSNLTREIDYIGQLPANIRLPDENDLREIIFKLKAIDSKNSSEQIEIVSKAIMERNLYINQPTIK